MCGIWTRAKSNQKINLEELIFPVSMLAHRGPDGYGWFADERVAMVHTRLSIIDLSGGQQPLTSYDQNFVGIVNGELYDYQEHKIRLIEKGITFKTKSDSEVLLNLFAEFGENGLRGLSGEWAFIFYNPKKNRLYFARDAHGVKPLFFKQGGGCLTLASEIKALEDATPDLSPDSINTFIARSLMPQTTSLEGCYHVLPGRLYSYDLQTQKMTHSIFDPLPLGRDRQLKGSDAVEATSDALRRAVKKRLVADVEVGCYLSGGVDSALTTALAVESGAKPKAFTVGFADRDFDETAVAARIAQHLGIEHHVCQMTAKNFIPSLIKSIVAFENPMTNPHGAAKNLLAQMASQHVKVVLSGEGADEWFGGYAYLRIQKLQKFCLAHPRMGKLGLERFFEKEQGRSMNHLDGRGTINEPLFREFFAGHSPAVLGRLSKHRAYSYLTGESLHERILNMGRSLQKMLFEEWPLFSSTSTDWDLNTWFGARVDLLHYILANVGDRQEMSHSLEGRTPFLDPEVVRVASITKESTLLRGLNEKSVLKILAQKVLPKEIAERPKHPFFAPIKYFYLKQHSEIINHHIQVAKAATPWLAWSHLDRLIHRPPSPTFPLEGLRNSMRTLLFSLGVIVEHLRETPTEQPRGFQIPRSVRDLSPYEIKMMTH